jgi:hypothetical protein
LEQLEEINLQRKSDDRGVIESALTLIPLTIFFLLVLQLAIAGSWKTIELARMQSLANTLAIMGNSQESQELLRSPEEMRGSTAHYSPLTGKGNLLELRAEPVVPGISTFIPGFLRIKTYALAVEE